MRSGVLFVSFVFCLSGLISQLSVFPNSITHCTSENVTVTATLNTNIGDFDLPENSTQDPYAASSIGIGFDFSFFGISYSSILLSENNFFTFNTNWTGTSYISHYFAHITGQLKNTILFPFQDLIIKNNTINNINTITIGEAGNQQFIVEYCGIELSNCSDLQSSSQVVLHEGTNIIDIHIINKPLACGGNSSSGIVGIIGPTGEEILIPPYDQPNASWNASQISIRLTPQPDGSYSFELIPFNPVLIDFNPKYSNVSWAAGSSPNTVLGTGQTFDITTPNTENYYICKYQSAEGCLAETNVTYYDTVWLNVKPSDTTLLDITCEKTLPYTWKQHSINTVGNHSLKFDTLSKINACDSVVTLKLTVHPTLTTTKTNYACLNDLPENASQYNDNLPITTIGIYQYVEELVSQTTGCDSLVTRILNVKDAVVVDTTKSFCETQLPWTWNNLSISNAGTYTQIFQTENGCDSTVNLTIIVHPTVLVTLSDTIICEHNLPFTWNQQTINSTGVHTLTNKQESIYGCDSITTRKFTVIPTEIIQLPDQTICFEQIPYTWKNKTISEFGTGSYSLSDTAQSSSTQCIEITKLSITILPEKKIVLTDTICNEELPYTWNGQTLSTDGDFILTHVEKSVIDPLCDSTTINNIHIRPPLVVEQNNPFCEQYIQYQTFYWNGYEIEYDYSPAKAHRGLHTSSYTTTSVITGCDSTINLTLWVDSTKRDTVTLFYCWKDNPGSWNGHLMESPGDYVFRDTFPQQLTGCDSIIVANITIDVPPPSAVIETCESELPFTYTTENGDVIYVAQLGVYHTKEVMWISDKGCVDKDITTWTVIPYGSVNYLDTGLVCTPKFPFTWHGKTFTEYPSNVHVPDADNFYRDTLYTGTGDCTNLNIYRLWIENDPHIDELDTTICETGMFFSWRYYNIQNPNDGLILVDTVKNASKIFSDNPWLYCDSIYTCTLTVIPRVYSTDVITICSDMLPYEWNGKTIEEDDLYNGSLYRVATLKQVENDCDSIVTLQLTVNPVKETTLQQIEICYQQLPYTWKGQQITESDAGTIVELTHIEQTYLDCDSVITFRAIVHPEITATETIGLCMEDVSDFIWNGQTVSGAGTHILTHTEKSVLTPTCDSITTAVVIVNDVIIEVVPDLIICEINLPFEWNEHKITEDMGLGTYSFESKLEREITQCDSTAKITIHVHPIYSTTFSDTIKICESAIPSGGYVWFEHTIYEAGIHNLKHDTVSKLTGCDSSVIQNFIIYPTKKTRDSLHYCDADLPLTWYGQTITQPGLYNTVFFVNYESNDYDVPPLMCDSIAEHVLHVGETRYRTLTPVIICESDTATFNWRGKKVTQTTELYDTFLSPVGCDSILNIHVTVVPTIKVINPEVEYCEGSLPFSWHSYNINVVGDYNLEHTTIVPSTGCPKIEYLHFISKKMDKKYRFDTICETELPFQYGIITVSEVPPFPHVRVLEKIDPKIGTGCDSMTVTALLVVPTPNRIIDSTICEYNLPNFIWNGQTAQDLDFQVLTHTTTPTLPKENKDSCDSITTLNLTIQRNPSITKKDIKCYQVNAGEIEIITPSEFTNYTFEWTDFPSHNSPLLENLAKGEYEVKVIHERCTTTHLIEITEPDPLQIDIIDNETLCFEDYTGSATVQASGGTFPYTYIWDDPNNQTTSVAINLLVGSYIVTVTDFNLCEKTKNVEIIKPPKLELNISADSVVCFGENNGKAHVVATGGILPYTYLWNDANNQTISSAINLHSGTYTVTVTDDNSCEKTETITVFEPDLLTVQFAKKDVACFGENNGEVSAIVSGGIIPYSYQWNDPNSQTTDIATNLFMGTYTITVNDKNNCKTKDSIKILQPDKLVLTTSNDTTICPYDFAKLTGKYIGGTTPITIDWGNGQNSWTITSQPKQDTIYKAIITDANQCKDSTQIKITVVKLPKVNFSDQLFEGCPPLLVNFDNLSTGNYTNCKWTLSDGTIFSQCGSFSHEINSIGDFDLTLTLQTAEGCITSKTQKNIIHTEPWPKANFDTEHIDYLNIDTEVEFTNTSSFATHYEWNFGDNSPLSTMVHPIHIYPDKATADYTIILTALNDVGCIDTAMSKIKITEVELIYVPNAFTPDNNVHNEYFIPIISSELDIDDYRLDIFNRWGEIVFTTRDINHAWDGKYNGVLQQSGVYTWKISIRAKNTDEMRNFVGMVTLLK